MLKLQVIGNSLGFRLPKQAIQEAEFGVNDQYEFFVEQGVVVIVKRLPHHSEWEFKDEKLNAEDRKWIESAL